MLYEISGTETLKISWIIWSVWILLPNVHIEIRISSSKCWCHDADGMRIFPYILNIVENTIILKIFSWVKFLEFIVFLKLLFKYFILTIFYLTWTIICFTCRTITTAFLQLLLEWLLTMVYLKNIDIFINTEIDFIIKR